MTIMILRLATAVILSAEAPAAATVPGGEPPYTATHYPRHNIYCVKNNPRAPGSGELRIAGRACHTERQWAGWGMIFARRRPASALAARP